MILLVLIYFRGTNFIQTSQIIRIGKSDLDYDPDIDIPMYHDD